MPNKLDLVTSVLQGEIVPAGSLPGPAPGPLSQAGRAADRVAAGHVFASYQQRRSRATLRSQRAGLLTWVRFLVDAGAAGPLLQAAGEWASTLPAERMEGLEQYAKQSDTPLPLAAAATFCQESPEAWRGVSWGLVEAFVQWLLGEGYAVSTINSRLSAVRVYVRLAAKAGVVAAETMTLVSAVRGYSEREAKRVNEGRALERVGDKKAGSIVLTSMQARMLKRDHPDTPRGRRDRLLLCLLLDFGLRASEAAGLKVGDIQGDLIRVYRPKVDKTSTLLMTRDIQEALAAYQPYMYPAGPLLRRSVKGGELGKQGLTTRAIGYLVKDLGKERLGIADLSPHDLRHTWATHVARTASHSDLQYAGGWTNARTPMLYIEESEVANERIKVDY